MTEPRPLRARAVHSGATQDLAADELEITLPGGIPLTVQDPAAQSAVGTLSHPAPAAGSWHRGSTAADPAARTRGLHGAEAAR
ncbi:hypothetical protein ABZ721_34135 [Streptomyces sp. NPDC006733]|uniref:hypothetical protein n=1 Tax=Streptomyces sp. NPDC006733 TaxID=3155460 RepID=UPI003405A244